jgi:uncharacterized protein YndB with AHSA1/START domain
MSKAQPDMEVETVVDPSPYDIELTRVFETPRESLYQAFTDPDLFARWYGPVGFPVPRDTIDLEARVGGPQRFTMVGEADSSMQTSFDGNFTEVEPNRLLASSGTWHGIPGQERGWASNLRVEFEDQGNKTRVVVREGPHPEGTADLGRQAWEMMLDKIDTLFKSS